MNVALMDLVIKITIKNFMISNRIIVLTILIMFMHNGFSQPNTFITKRENLNANLKKIRQNNSFLCQAKKELLNAANKIINKKEVYSVTFKSQFPPSNSKNDFYSLSRYAWPDPESKNGLPYITIDGKINPEIKEIPDSYMLGNLSSDVYILGLAYFFTENEKYSRWVKKIIDVFFINEKTKMNPSFKYSHIVKGKNVSSSTIGSMVFLKLIDGIQLIKPSKNWTAGDHKDLGNWFKRFLEWLINSEQGKKNSVAPNNIGTYYTDQIAAYALFTNQPILARNILNFQGKERIETQIDAQGKMPLELNRATPWEYVKYNLTAFDYMVQIGNTINVDLLDYQNSKGGSIRKAFDWLLPFATGQKKWTYGNQVSGNQIQIVLLRLNSVRYNGINYNGITNRFDYLEILTGDVY